MLNEFARPILTVTELLRSVRDTLERRFPLLWVRGELSNLSRAPSGHLYFTLKDRGAQVDCVMFRSRAAALEVPPRDGMQVEANVLVGLYEPRGRFQLTVEALRPAGLGPLYERFLKLKEKLEREGLFDAASKKPLPSHPRAIGVVTSLAAAALRDVLTTLERRNRAVPVVVYPAPVQGEGAADRLATMIARANRRAECDVLLLVRGGGSIEDLWQFNEERLARAIRASRIPVVVGVGHETDFTIADFAADRRAPTPTAAAEIAVPVRAELLSQTLDFERRVTSCFLRGLTQRRNHVTALARVLPRADQLFANGRQRLDYASENLGRALWRNLQEHRRGFREIAASLRPEALQQHIAVCGERVSALRDRLVRRERTQMAGREAKLEGLSRILESVSYRNILERGFALVRSPDGTLMRRAAAIASGEELILTFADESTSAVAVGPPRQSLHRSGRPKKPGKDQGSLF